jgi:hypothetical protein
MPYRSFPVVATDGTGVFGAGVAVGSYGPAAPAVGVDPAVGVVPAATCVTAFGVKAGASVLGYPEPLFDATEVDPVVFAGLKGAAAPAT